MKLPWSFLKRVGIGRGEAADTSDSSDQVAESENRDDGPATSRHLDSDPDNAVTKQSYEAETRRTDGAETPQGFSPGVEMNRPDKKRRKEPLLLDDSSRAVLARKSSRIDNVSSNPKSGLLEPTRPLDDAFTRINELDAEITELRKELVSRLKRQNEHLKTLLERYESR